MGGIKRANSAVNDKWWRKNCKTKKINSRVKKICWEKTNYPCNFRGVKRYRCIDRKTWRINSNDWIWGQKRNKEDKKGDDWDESIVRIENGGFDWSKIEVEQNWNRLHQDMRWNYRKRWGEEKRKNYEIGNIKNILPQEDFWDGAQVEIDREGN